MDEAMMRFLLLSYILYVIAFVGLLVIPAAFNLSLGFKDFYVHLLLKIFRFGQKKLEANQQLLHQGNGLIDKGPHSDETEVTSKVSVPKNKSITSLQKEFHLVDACEFATSAAEAIIEDEVTQRFGAEELPSWNLLTRTNLNYTFISWRLTVIWIAGFLVRYVLFLPVRITIVLIGVSSLTVFMAIVSFLPQGRFREWFCHQTAQISFRLMSRGLSAVIYFHDKENKAKGGGICVANHTSPIDAIFLSCDNCYALVGQMQGGIMGFVQRCLLKAQHHIFFERSEVKDRHLVTKRLRSHVEDPTKNPILIFPEGTCINNTSVMMFKKGSFEVGGTIYPVAIKYDSIFGNAFWDSIREPMLQYLINIMTSWAIVCNIWYLPPMTKKENETSIEFANRVKKLIAEKGGLVDLVWDGQLKRMKVPPSLKAKQQEDFANTLKLD